MGLENWLRGSQDLMHKVVQNHPAFPDLCPYIHAGTTHTHKITSLDSFGVTNSLYNTYVT